MSSALDNVAASDIIFGNGWIPGSGRRVVVKAQDSTWNITRNDRFTSAASALGVGAPD
ncbi:hypothetical protein GGI07_005708 [Coemansia sp. Benny D115]|nr:hypothetical protein GGI07_005708 [Coemansia sp. Benny D115]